MSSHYKSNRSHTEFLLFQVFRDETMSSGAYEDFDIDTARDILQHIDEFAHKKLAPSFAAGDNEGLEFDPDTGSVTLPPSLKQAVRDHLESDWLKIDLPTEFTGMHVPPSLRMAATEFVLGANPAMAMCTTLIPPVVNLLHKHGNAAQKRLAELIVEKGWTTTMVLTEPDAGSDVGAARTKAVPQEDGTWHLQGAKRFITWAAHDATENVIHAVLARPTGTEGAGGPGTKGLSLFIVPEYNFDPETGEILTRNGAFVRSIEKKMGIKGAPTCELIFGDEQPAVGTLLGDRHEGIRQMFDIITHIRMIVGLKAAAALSTGYLTARAYSEERIQGHDFVEGPTGGGIPILDHPDIRRSLMTQRAYAEGCRALILYTATQLDRIEAARAHGTRDVPAEERHGFLLPIVKAWCSEHSFRILASESLQTLGGVGYTAEFPLEQYVRDTKIDSIYEGTTGIQALDLLTRRIQRDRGAVLELMLKDVQQTVEDLLAHHELEMESTMLLRAIGTTREYVRLSLERLDSQPKLAAMGATRLLLLIGDVIVAWTLLRSAVVARSILAEEPQHEDAQELMRRIAAARWFARQVLPRIAGDLESFTLLQESDMVLPRAQL
ncbi:MAG: acyl-CoA dehydrogenase [Propionibacteriaceae bacterium]|nr:acyl-CoA dehydrogenase [Propionibacteriaceae bacterium]